MLEEVSLYRNTLSHCGVNILSHICNVMKDVASLSDELVINFTFCNTLSLHIASIVSYFRVTGYIPNILHNTINSEELADLQLLVYH